MAVSGSKPLEDSDLPPRRPKTGLISRSELREEVARAKQEEIVRFQSMDPLATGKGAEPIYRDDRGQRISRIDYMRAREKKVKGEPRKKKKEEPEWGKGLVQKRQAQAELEELESEKKKPFARSRDDPELDAMLGERVRWGDPMMKKTRSEPVVADLGDDERMRASGFVVPQQVPTQSWIKRGLCEATNIYGIKPGRHWDGVDRSIKFNGFLNKPTESSDAQQAPYPGIPVVTHFEQA